jgi:hypothetical protein
MNRWAAWLGIFANPVTVIGATGTIAGVMAMHPMHAPWLQTSCQVWSTAAPMLLAHSWMQGNTAGAENGERDEVGNGGSPGASPSKES